MSATFKNPRTSAALLYAPLLAALCCLAAAVAVATPGWVLSGDVAHTLGCTLSLPPGGGTHLLLVNRGAQDLPAGTAIVWHDTGTPRGVAEKLLLPEVLASGDSLRVSSAQRARGPGCGARWLRPEREP
jgi:hypothetical protein